MKLKNVMNYMVDSTEIDFSDPASCGMVKCENCIKLQSADKKGVRRCWYQPYPSLVQNKWRRCDLFAPRITQARKR